jgi:phospholipase C
MRTQGRVTKRPTGKHQSIGLLLPIVAVTPLLVDCESDGTNDQSLLPDPVCTPAEPAAAPPKSTGPTHLFDKINHFVVIYMENHSFDNLYGADSLGPSKSAKSPGGNPQSNVCDMQKGMFPSAEGLGKVKTFAQQDQTGAVYGTLPNPLDTSKSPPAPDPLFPGNLKNGPFDLINYQSTSQKEPDLVHRWYQEPLQIDKGKMDRFVAYSDSKGLSMGYYQTCQLPLAQLATGYTLSDHFFHAAFGGSFLNHQWLIAAASPVFPDAPTSAIAQLDAKGNLLVDGFVTPKGCYVVNTAFTINKPHPSVSASQLVPNQTQATIGDRLNDAQLDWAWYSGGWNDAIAGNPASTFQFHHQPFAYFKNYADGTPGRAAHLKDEADLTAAVQTSALPAVAFVKFLGLLNEHPGYSDVAKSEKHAVDLINAIMASDNWKDTAIILTYDENGGQWDHVAPPTTDKWGPGTRVPTIIISPYAKKGYVDPTPYDTTSILATIEHRWGLDPLTSRDAAITDLANAFDFTQTP